MSVDFGKRVDQFVKLRDLIKQKDEEHKKSMAPLKDTLEKLSAVLLQHLNSTNGNSVSTDFGTVYRTEKKSAPLADPQAFMDYVIARQAWDLLDRKANVTAVEAFVDEHQAPPPGVNFSSTFTVGVKRK